jgi:hypothetical protein
MKKGGAKVAVWIRQREPLPQQKYRLIWRCEEGVSKGAVPGQPTEHPFIRTRFTQDPQDRITLYSQPLPSKVEKVCLIRENWSLIMPVDGP